MKLKLVALLLVTSLFLVTTNSSPFEAKAAYANEFLLPKVQGENGASVSNNVQTEALFTSTQSKDNDDEPHKIHDNSKKGGVGGGGRGLGLGTAGGAVGAGLNNHPSSRSKNGASMRSTPLFFVALLCIFSVFCLTP